MNAYEMTFIVRPDLDEDAARAAIEQVTGRIESAGGELLATVPWNPPRRRMAYPIRDFGDGYYITTVFRLDAQQVRTYENQLKLNDNVIRYLLVQATDTNIQQAQQRVAQAAAAAARPAQPAAPAAEQATAANSDTTAPEIDTTATAADAAVEAATAAPETETTTAVAPQTDITDAQAEPVLAAIPGAAMAEPVPAQPETPTASETPLETPTEG